MSERRGNVTIPPALLNPFSPANAPVCEQLQKKNVFSAHYTHKGESQGENAKKGASCYVCWLLPLGVRAGLGLQEEPVIITSLKP